MKDDVSRTFVFVVGVAFVLMASGCQRENRAQQIASQAATSEQARLWQEVAGRGTPSGLQRLPLQNPAAEPRRQPAQPSAQAIAPAQGSLAPGVTTGARLVSTSQPGGLQYSGQATVLDVVGERIELDLGPIGRVAFVARLNGMPLGVIKGQPVALVVRSNGQIFERQEIFAIRTMGGAEIITALQTGPQPVVLTVTLPPLTLVATQVGTPVNGAMDVVIDVGGAKEPLKPATVLPVGGLFVTLLGSIAQPAAGTTGDSSPYAIDLIAWRAGPASP